MRVFTKGFDVPDIYVASLHALPQVSVLAYTAAWACHAHRAGQGFALWLDHSGNVIPFGQETAEIFANGILDDGSLVEARQEGATKDELDALKCGGCGYILPRAMRRFAHVWQGHCPSAKPGQAIDGEMVEVGGKRAVKHPVPGGQGSNLAPDMRLLAWKKRGEVRGAERFAKAQYRNIYGGWPRHAMRNINPSEAWLPELENMIRANVIRWAPGIQPDDTTRPHPLCLEPCIAA